MHRFQPERVLSARFVCLSEQVSHSIDNAADKIIEAIEKGCKSVVGKTTARTVRAFATAAMEECTPAAVAWPP